MACAHEQCTARQLVVMPLSVFLDDHYFWFMERKSQYSKTVGTGLLFNNTLVVQIVGLSERVLCRWVKWHWNEYLLWFF
jgi:hypothetical protein